MEKTIEEQNRMIAEFMGLNVGENGTCKPYPKVPSEYFTCHDFDVWKVSGHPYNTSWDWLMPVVEKIEAVGYGFGIIPYNGVTVYDTPVVINQSSTKIESVYQAVIAFLTWYNQQ